MERNITYSMGGGNGKKDVYAKRTTYFQKHAKIDQLETNVSFAYPTDTDAKKTITDAKPTVQH